MHLLSRSVRPKQLPSLMRTFLAGFVVLGLCLVGVGCDSGGSNGGGEEPPGEEPGPTAPAAPSGLEASSGDAQIGLDWDAVSEAETYKVYRSTSSTDGAEGDPLAEDLSEASYTDDSVENGTTYYYRVTAEGSEGNESDASGEVQATPFDEPPSRP